MLTEIPQIGFGTWTQTGGEGEKLVTAALEAGYRHIDTADAYDNETEVGNAVAASGIPRERLWITTKIPASKYGEVRKAAEQSLGRLKVDQVDLLYLHWPSNDMAMEDYLKPLAQAQDEGLARHIGVSNFNKVLVDEAAQILGGPERIFMNQIELSPYLANTPIVQHCRSLGIGLTAYSPLARGKIKGDPILKGLGDELGATEGQVALAYLMYKGYVVIPTSSKPERIAENLAAKDLELSDANIDQIDRLDRKKRIVDPDFAPEWDAY
ncbi:aldo/keto reductase [Psychromarinibacter sp. S121]|uniref:aldo/keto reductase n=1 Tax=Psychromarinibacter sp. S121 TaxID=3415127 RepID=UPI003C7972A3